jgi:hypothetical protein
MVQLKGATHPLQLNHESRRVQRILRRKMRIRTRKKGRSGERGRKTLPHFAFVLRALLTNAPKSCPPERVFSMFNATLKEDQKSSFGDYLDLAIQSQYNKRNLRGTFFFCVCVCNAIFIYM